MRKRARVAAAAVIALGLGLSACSQAADPGTSENMTSTAASSTTPALPGMYSPVSAEGVTLAVDSAYIADSVDMRPETGAYDDIQPDFSREDGVFVVLETTVKNEGGTDMDITCAATGAHVYAEVSTDQDAVYKPVRGLHRIPTNPECNHNLGSGFDTSMTWVFEIPKGSTAERFGFAHSELGGGELTWINLDEVSDSAPTSSATTPREEPQEATEETAPTRENPEIATKEDAQIPVVPQQVTETSVAPAPAPAPAAPAYGASCPVSMVQQPGRATDGSPLVCIYAGTDSPIWVYGPEPYGAGTASEGGACDGYEAGGQDAAGRMMMCSDGQWVYGP